MELEEELKVVGNSLKSLEVSEEKVICFSFSSFYIVPQSSRYVFYFSFFFLIIDLVSLG